jgi:hypothetical protein
LSLSEMRNRDYQRAKVFVLSYNEGKSISESDPSQLSPSRVLSLQLLFPSRTLDSLLVQVALVEVYVKLSHLLAF